MKIIHLFFFIIILFTSTAVLALDALTQDGPWEFNKLFNEALKQELLMKKQEASWETLLDEARAKVQNIRKTKEGTDPNEILHTIWNDFCQWLYGTCDETSIYARMMAACETARNTAFENMDSSFVRNNTEFLLSSYTTCPDLMKDIVNAHKDSAVTVLAGWQGEQIIKSQEKFTEKTQTNFQEKVSTIWDVFKKKLTNFVRSIEGITRYVNTRW